ncbi:transcriptional regulator [Desulfuromonas versatilis]|uniref:Transcriptional regulator n=1 Tax=Desulfuromonas versatilis TaxID=2802975 RepID=A0ABM8HPS9_9BACT|nr:metalloregulator ArsR/SmtB family transcription factor [Desulfuromonas versatilis]BCR03692.1 transcriptional regulator [Desulfuromonas versatilis]
MNHDLCQVTIVHQDRLARARRDMPAEADLLAQAELYKLLGEPTRLRLLQALSVEELCVCDLAALLDSSPSAVSHQLRLLRTAGLVRFRRDGKMVYYSLDDAHLRTLLAEGERYVEERIR